jgi:hypothetical protein
MEASVKKLSHKFYIINTKVLHRQRYSPIEVGALDDREANYNNIFEQNPHKICDYKFDSVNTMACTDKGTYK